MAEKTTPVKGEITNVQLDRFCSSHAIVNAVFARRALNLKHHRSVDRRMSEADFKEVLKVCAGEIFAEYVSDRSQLTVFNYASSVVCVLSFYAGEGYSASIAGDNKADVESLEKELLKALPVIKAEGGKIPLTFWTLGAHGPVGRHRKIVVPAWPDIGSNYPSEVGDGLNKLMQMSPGRSGQLIMFHGVPGTGKSYAIRALLREWSKWCNADYIVDPERFFGTSAEYMISVLLGGNEEHEEPVGQQNGDDKSKNPWRIYIVEDGDEFLTTDAKARSGQALSRLLNVVDGMIGQGLQVLVLVTTNEPLEGIHPAVTRPGRCLANIEFRKFNKKEGNLWLNGDGKNIDVTEDYTLAELFHKRGEVKSLRLKADKPLIGFG